MNLLGVYLRLILILLYFIVLNLLKFYALLSVII